VVGHLGNAPSCLPVPSQADFFLPHARWRMAEGFHPKPLPRFYLFSRQGTTTQCFTIHKVVIPARIALAASSFAGKRSCSAELRDNWWRITVSRRTLPGAGRSCHILSLIPQRSAAGRNCTRILDVRSVALWILLSYGSDKVEHRLRLALSRIWVAARRFGFFTLRCKMVRRPGNAPGWARKPTDLQAASALY
jgi:hypothetical protein